MAASDYTNLANAKVVAEIPAGDTSRDALINLLIPRVSRHIDLYCHRFFYPKTASYKYDYQGEYKLWLRNDLNTLTGITNGDGTAMDITTLFLYPEVGPPYQWIEVNRSSSVVYRWGSTTDQQVITVTGSWGYLEDGATPIAINDACDAWIKYLLMVSKNAGVKSKTIGDYSVSYSAVLDFLRNGPPNEATYYLDTYTKRRFATQSRVIAP